MGGAGEGRGGDSILREGCWVGRGGDSIPREGCWGWPDPRPLDNNGVSARWLPLQLGSVGTVVRDPEQSVGCASMAMFETVTPDMAKALGKQKCNQGKVNFREKEKQVLDQILGPGRYDARIRPSGVNGTDGPTIVRVNLFVRSIATISDNKMGESKTNPIRETSHDLPNHGKSTIDKLDV
uniref:Uncharacterized protein n=1 Tax=Timema bartmani TaxID=61472 RepID=A0A7R9ELN4_9NEOP|nr:unnamed protein product [Timema bartmani]